MEQSVQAHSANQTPNDADLLVYHIGDEFSGETEFRIKGDGDYYLQSTVTAGRESKTYTGRIDPTQVAELVTALQQAGVWEVRHIRSRPGEDDPEASLTLESGGTTTRVALWVSEIRESPQFTQAQQALLPLIRRLSNGEVLEGGQ